VSVVVHSAASPRAFGRKTTVGEGMSGKEVEALASRDETPSTRTRAEDRVIDSCTLFGQSREVRITHNGESYSLRLTRLGKLILTK
jgi:hemin uptake protein HemP